MIICFVEVIMNILVNLKEINIIYISRTSKFKDVYCYNFM